MISKSEAQTKLIAAELAEKLFPERPCFVELIGPLGAGKSTFARGFIEKWSELSGDKTPEVIVSPTYNLAKIYGEKIPLAHLDLYRIHDLSELEQIGYEQYFYEMPCVLVEWLNQIPQGQALAPQYKKTVTLELDSDDLNQRQIKIS